MVTRPEDWEAELEGPAEGVGDGGPPVFRWSFSAFRFSTVLWRLYVKRDVFYHQV